MPFFALPQHNTTKADEAKECGSKKHTQRPGTDSEHSHPRSLIYGHARLQVTNSYRDSTRGFADTFPSSLLPRFPEKKKHRIIIISSMRLNAVKSSQLPPNKQVTSIMWLLFSLLGQIMFRNCHKKTSCDPFRKKP